jgi:hypothetical protein
MSPGRFSPSAPGRRNVPPWPLGPCGLERSRASPPRPHMRRCCLSFGLAAPQAGRFNQGRPGSSCGSHRERPQAGEPGLIARQAPGSLSIGVRSQFPVDSTFETFRSSEWLNCHRLAGDRRPRHPNRMAVPVGLRQVAGKAPRSFRLVGADLQSDCVCGGSRGPALLRPPPRCF